MKILKHPASLIAIGAILGVIFGLIVGDWAANLAFIGDIFIRLIQMSIVPLVMSSVIVATGGMTGSGMGKLAGRTFGWILGFSAIAAVVAWLLSLLIRPGAGMVYEGEPVDVTVTETGSWQDMLLSFVSTNVVEAMSTASMIPLVVFSLIFGLALNRYIAATGNDLVLKGLEQLQQIVLLMIRMVMYVAPIGVFAILANLAGATGFSVVTTALLYLATTLIGVVIIFALMIVVVAIFTGLSPAKLPAKLLEQTMVAITTTSSAVTFPTVLKNAVEKAGVSQRVANFTLSIGLTMGSCGAVLNDMIVIMFLAQAGGVDLDASQVLLGIVLVILLNMGTITVPGGFAVVAVFLAGSLGLPTQAVGLLIAVDWFTGVLRTFLSVNGDTMVAMLVAKSEGELDKDVYSGTKTVTSEKLDEDAMKEQFAKADAAD